MEVQTGKSTGVADIDFVTVIPGATLKYSPEQVDAGYAAIARWATNIVRENKRPTMLVSPLQGSLLITSELIRRVQAPICFRAVKVSLYDADNEARENVDFDFWPISDDELAFYDFVVPDDVAETLRTYAAMRERLAAKGAVVRCTMLVDKPTEKRIVGLRPDFAPLTAEAHEWLVAECMNDGDDFKGEACRCVRGIWVKNQ